MGGVGKSCALKGLATDADVQEHLSGGIYWIVLGKDCTEADVVRRVARIAKQSGGVKVAKSVLEEESIDGAVSEARRWFSGQRSLLLVDDVWDKNDVGRDIVRRLCEIVDTKKGSRLAFTTRDWSVVGNSEAVEFSKRSREVSREILLRSAGLAEEEVKDYRELVNKTLDLCGGLPMALSVAGSAISMRRRNARDVNLREIWNEYLRLLGKHPGRLINGKVSCDAYETLRSAFETSLKMLDETLLSEIGCPMTYDEMYRSVVVILRQGWLPVSVLGLLWGLEDEDEVTEVLNVFSAGSLAERRDRILNGSQCPGITLHDLQLDFVEDKCRKHGEVKKWHEKIARRWQSKRYLGAGAGSDRWAKDDIFEDDYVRNNVSRHLLGAGHVVDLSELLTDPEWVVRRLVGREILGLEGDFGILRHQLEEGNDNKMERRSTSWSLKMIAEAARLCAPFVSQNTEEVWFQLHARLIDVADHSKLLQKYSADIEKYADKPWLRAMRPCLSAPGVLQFILLCSGRVYGLSAFQGKENILIWGRSAKGAFVDTFVSGELKESSTLQRQQNETRDSNVDGGIGAEDPVVSDEILSSESSFGSQVRRVYVSKDGDHAAIIYKNGRMEVWDVRKRKTIGKAIGEDENAVVCAAWSPDGSRLAFGEYKNDVKIWDVNARRTLGNVLLGNVGYIMCLAWSLDGKQLASAGAGKTILIWNLENQRVMKEIFRGEGSNISCIAWSPNGFHLASGGWDDSVWIWNVETGKAVQTALKGHGGSVHCVSWSTDGMQLASGGADGTVRVWDVKTSEAKERVLFQPGNAAHCVEWSPDGTQLAVGAADAKVTIWRVEDQKATRSGSCLRNDFASCVSWSPDGSRLGCWGANKVFQIWDVETGKVIQEVKPGRETLGELGAWSPNGSRLAFGIGKESVVIWDSDAGRVVGESLNCCGVILCLSWSPDGSWLASAGEGDGVRIWDMQTGEAVGGIPSGHQGSVQGVGWSPDGSHLASAGVDGTVNIWKAKTMKAVGEPLRGHNKAVQCVAWSPDGLQLATGGYDTTVRIWDVVNGKGSGMVLGEHESSVRTLEWLPDGSSVISEALDGRRVWDVATEEEIDEVVTSNLRVRGKSVFHVTESEEKCLATLDLGEFQRNRCSPSGRHLTVWDGKRLIWLEFSE
ncbi:WD40-repeat containing protein [Chondrus crispus]|uniref:WD40-repeat containing protein n=1 Tax=Chondrus crispus TaxID=2769 RepID=R7QDV4_CHOCR|nr:WD40-repeat containing protein [Chondrus crispus]CDF35626.1 WD40-repeat containing protein [Chondrus crispus]|eukprot:XP_005715445.1 WD40-repeat containing protein [Chondrus crispus]